MKKIVLFFLLLSTSVFAQTTLSQKIITKAKEGNFFISQQRKMASLLLFKEKGEKVLILEEISFPIDLVKEIQNYHDWVEKKAPGHTSWIIYAIDLKSHELLEAYSFSRDSYLHFHEEEHLLSTLLGLSLTTIPDEQRKKIGPEPSSGNADYRKLWTPPMVIEGKKAKGNFSAFYTQWPKDSSPLSNKRLELYFEENQPLPLWIQVYSSHGSVFSKIIDTGKGLQTPYSLPKKLPQFLDKSPSIQNDLQIRVSLPKYFQDFDLLAVDDAQKSTPLTYTIEKLRNETFLLYIDKTGLEKNKNYSLFLFPNLDAESFAQSKKTFTLTE